MISAFSRSSETKVRQAILRGVYEENLAITGKRRIKLTHSRTFFLKKTFIVLLLSLIALLTQQNSLTTVLFPAGQVMATPSAARIAAQSSAEPSEDSVKPSEYAAMLGDRKVPLSRMFGLGVRTIMIDPGHGGSDSGAIGGMGTLEKDITLDIARRLKARLLSTGKYRVLMTREDDSRVSLNGRVEMAQRAKADLFISIHLNYLPHKPINIIETYYFGPPSDDKTRKLAEKENAGSDYSMSDFKEIIEKIGHTMKLQESREFAGAIQKNLFLNSRRVNEDIQDFGVKRAPFVVLLGVDVPAVLAEVSCLSNKEEEVQLGSEGHRDNIARYLEAGILDYLNRGG